jgi:MFS family permease
LINAGRCQHPYLVDFANFTTKDATVATSRGTSRHPWLGSRICNGFIALTLSNEKSNGRHSEYPGVIHDSSRWTVSRTRNLGESKLKYNRERKVTTTFHTVFEPRSNMDTESQPSSPGSEAHEDQPLLRSPDQAPWHAPRGFVLIEIAIMANVFLYGLDSTITAATYGVISSEFNAANTASWLTTSYLVTSTAFQPLYGRVSDIFGRRVCFFISTITFALGCLGCGVANDVVFLNIMRALTGFGGGGLMTMATIINSDMIPFHKRGMYQALQNGMNGFGAIAGASFGGSIADHIGWRWCFLLQVPVSVLALIVGYLVIKNPPITFTVGDGFGAVWKRVDVSGSLLLVAAVSVQLVGLSLGGNELPWGSPWVTLILVGSVVLFALFFWVEAHTNAIPVIPLRLLKGRLPVATQLTNVCAGTAAYGVSQIII